MHKRCLITLILVLAARVAFAQQTRDDEQSEPLPKGYHPVAANKVASIQKLCMATADTGLFSGSVLVADQGQVIYRQAFGMANREWSIPNTTDTKFRLASVSKQFCSMLVMQLVQEGLLSLDDTISDHLSYYRKDTGDVVTIHHLLSHQSGIRDFTASPEYRRVIMRSSFGKDEFIKLYCSGELDYEPGTIYSYCNAGYCILGRIIERVTGKTFERCLRERIFEPLQMTDTGVDRNRFVLGKRASGYTYGPFGIENADYVEMDSAPGPAGGLYSTIDDMFLWDRALHDDRLLNAQYREVMFRPNREVPEVKAAGGRPHSNYGYGWQIYSRKHPLTSHRTKVITHGGAINGFRAMEVRLVDDDAFIIILCNQGDPYGESAVWNAVTRLSTELIHIVTEQPFRMPGKAGPTQDQRMYALVDSQGVQAAIDWFQANGKQAAWGGSLNTLVTRLLEEGQTAQALQLMEFDVELTPNKVWLLRKTCQAFWENGNALKALRYASMGLALRPDDEVMLQIKSDAEEEMTDNSDTNAEDDDG